MTTLARIVPLERIVEGGAAALLGGAVAYAGAQVSGPAVAAAAALLAFGVAVAGLRLAGGAEEAVRLAAFEIVPLDPCGDDAGELLLTADMARAGAAPRESAEDAEELLLDDILAEIEPDSRVVRLFAPLPTPGALRDAIDRHIDLQEAGDATVAPDASRALSEALAELRRSLR